MGYYNDDGTEVNPDLYPKPSLCVLCTNNDKASEEIVCNLTRMDQVNDEEFICDAYAKA